MYRVWKKLDKLGIHLEACIFPVVKAVSSWLGVYLGRIYQTEGRMRDTCISYNVDKIIQVIQQYLPAFLIMRGARILVNTG